MIEVRPATTRDAPAIAEQYAHLHRDQWAGTSHHPPGGDEPDWRGEVEAALAAPETRLFAADADGQLIGTVRVEFADRPYFRIADIRRLYVSPAWRRRGVATELMRVAEAAAAEGGAAEVRLSVLAGNDGATRFYGTLDYAEFAVRFAKRLPGHEAG